MIRFGSHWKFGLVPHYNKIMIIILGIHILYIGYDNTEYSFRLHVVVMNMVMEIKMGKKK